jgi:hypothetical protein
MQRIAALIVLSVVMAAIAGCGGGGDSNTVTTSSLSKAAYTKKANALCEEARQEALAFRLPPAQEEEGTAKAVTTTVHQGILPPIQRVMEEVRELGAPKGDEEKVEAILVGNEEAIEKAEGMKFSSMTDMEQVFLSTAEKARHYGIDNCGY